MKKVNWIENAYKNTSVYWGKTQSDIMKMLEQIGINEKLFSGLENQFMALILLLMMNFLREQNLLLRMNKF